MGAVADRPPGLSTAAVLLALGAEHRLIFIAQLLFTCLDFDTDSTMVCLAAGSTSTSSFLRAARSSSIALGVRLRTLRRATTSARRSRVQPGTSSKTNQNAVKTVVVYGCRLFCGLANPGCGAGITYVRDI